MQQGITLPVSIVSPTDIARLAREIESLDSYFQQQSIRTGGTPNTMPRLSKLMDQLAAYNQMNLLEQKDRMTILQLLESLHQSAPILHISFSVDPPGAYVQKIVDWLRRNVHQYVLVTVGLQPNIGAGCIVRTTNKLFDFSLREYFAQKREFFIEKLHESIADGQDSVARSYTANNPQTPASAIPQPISVAVSAQETERQEKDASSAVNPPTAATSIAVVYGDGSPQV